MLRFSIRRTPAAVLCRGRGYVTHAPPEAAGQPVTTERVWALWNEGNLFSLSAAELTSFLKANQAEVEEGVTRAGLVRRVEEMMRQKEQQGSSAAADSRDYGRFDRTEPRAEGLLDLSQSGFYEGGAESAPRAFQLLVADAATDFVVARTNTTSFPGFPANTESYTLAAADAQQATQARYNNALQWCVMNMRNLGIDGELRIDFGKLLMKPDVARKNRRVVSSWTLQQRLQLSDPYHWVSAVSGGAVDTVEQVLAAKGFSPPTSSTLQYDVTVHRPGENITATLNDKGDVMSLGKAWVYLQSAHLVRPGGPDVRFVLRSQPPLPKKDADTYRKVPLIDFRSEEVKALLPPELGKVVYASENDVRRWEKKLASGLVLAFEETKRAPLMITRDEEDGERVEYSMRATLPAGAQVDPTVAGTELFGIAAGVAEACEASFVAEFKTSAVSPSIAAE